MKFINTRKFTWIICIIGFLLALVSISYRVLFQYILQMGLRMIMEEKYKYFYFLYYKCLSLF